MFTFLDNLRRRPENERKMIAMGTAFSITALIAIIWFITATFESSKEVQEVSEQVPGPLESATDVLEAGLEDFFK